MHHSKLGDHSEALTPQLTHRTKEKTESDPFSKRVNWGVNSRQGSPSGTGS